MECFFSIITRQAIRRGSCTSVRQLTHTIGAFIDAWNDHLVEAIGPGGRLLAVLDADITLSPSGKQATVLTLAGTYRPPPGSLGAGLGCAVLHRVAAATIRNFLNGLAAGITGYAATAGSGTAGPGPSRLPPAPEVS